MKLVQLGFLTSEEILERVMRTTSVHVTVPVVLSAIAQEWGMDLNGNLLPPRKLNREQLERLYNFAGNYRHLAEILGVQRGTVKRHLSRLGIAELPVEKQKRRPATKKSRALRMGEAPAKG